MDELESPRIIHGLQLRSFLVLTLLERRAPMSVADLRAALTRAGLAAPGRAGKSISDALRWEVRRGRVVWRGPDSYGPGYVAKVTRHRMRARVARGRAASQK